MSPSYIAAPFNVPVVIIGAGPGGAATSKALHDAGIPSLMLEATATIGGQWHDDAAKAGQWEDTEAFSVLPRDERITSPAVLREYMRCYVESFSLFKRVHTQAPVWRIARRTDGRFRVSYTHYGKPQQIDTETVVIATGAEQNLSWFSAELREAVAQDLHDMEQYAHTFAPRVPGLAFIGMFGAKRRSLPALEQKARYIAMVQGAAPVQAVAK